MKEPLTPEQRKAKQRAYYKSQYSRPEGYNGNDTYHKPDENYAATLESRYQIRLPIWLAKGLRGII